jgi:hypothetical protein
MKLVTDSIFIMLLVCFANYFKALKHGLLCSWEEEYTVNCVWKCDSKVYGHRRGGVKNGRR